MRTKSDARVMVGQYLKDSDVAKKDLGPEKHLLLAIILDARKELIDKEGADTARTWFESRSRRIGSYYWCCLHLGVSVAQIRRACYLYAERCKERKVRGGQLIPQGAI